MSINPTEKRPFCEFQNQNFHSKGMNTDDSKNDSANDDKPDEFGLTSGQSLPEDENIWKIITHYAELRGKDLTALSQVSTDAHKAVAPQLTFSEAKFRDFMHKCSGHHFYGDRKTELEELLRLEQQIYDLIDLNNNNPDFRAAMSEWIALMKHENNWTVKQTETNDPTETLTHKVEQLKARVEKDKKLHRPSFRTGVKKVAKGVAGTVTGVGAVLSLPVAIVGIPFMIKHGPRSGSKSAWFIAPLYFTGMLTLSMFKGIDNPNFRNTGEYLEFKRICDRIEQRLVQIQETHILEPIKQ